jgi:hypothetical protein
MLSKAQDVLSRDQEALKERDVYEARLLRLTQKNDALQRQIKCVRFVRRFLSVIHWAAFLLSQYCVIAALQCCVRSCHMCRSNREVRDLEDQLQVRRRVHIKN